MNKSILALVASTLLAASAPTLGAGDIEQGREKAFTCTGCHSAPGLRNAYPGYTVPKIGGQHADYIVAALKGYRSKERSHPTMQAHAATMTDEDMADIAAYFSSLGAN